MTIATTPTTAAAVTRVLRRNGYPTIKGRDTYWGNGKTRVTYYTNGDMAAYDLDKKLTELGYLVERHFCTVHVVGKTIPDKPPRRTSTRTPQQIDQALSAYPNRNPNDLAATLADLLADLMHYADTNKIDFQKALDSAKTHYTRET